MKHTTPWVPKVLVVDDERDLVRLIRYNLVQEGYDVSCAFHGNEALDMIRRDRPDVIVLDWMLPDCSGLDICRKVKQTAGGGLNNRLPGLSASATPTDCRILMLTARAAQNDRISGLEAGADDYLTKPFSPRELILRVRSLLNRSGYGTAAGAAGSAGRETLTVGPLEICPDEFRVTVYQTDVELTPLEFKLLYSLASSPNLVKTREQLLAEVWQNDAEAILDRTVDAHIKRLRNKLGEARDLLETVRGVGYRLKKTA